MQHDIDKFDAADWLARWTAAGGGYAGATLLFPKPQPPFLRKMFRDLSGDQIQALTEHLGVERKLTE
jgi:hypothetical protein